MQPEGEMADAPKAYSKESSMKEAEAALTDEHQRESFRRLIGQLESDPAAMIALKGHLVIEEKIDAILEKFVFHPEHLENARLQFAQKLAVSRCLSLDDDKNSVWDLVSRLNSLRNALSHSLEGTRRAKAMDALRAAYVKERENELEEWEKTDEGLVTGTVSMCVGFLDSFEQEVERFRGYVDRLDKVINPHRQDELNNGVTDD
jgi:hypothetical protein